MQKRMIDIDELREELGFAENCKNCKRKHRECNDCCYSLYDFCTKLDTAIETILEKHNGSYECVVEYNENVTSGEEQNMKKGKWYHLTKFDEKKEPAKCSECLQWFPKVYYEWNNERKKYLFCPNCGADMTDYDEPWE